jgi:alpha-D-ribose 1-methylphosphonate 5-triphosphate synthase subunit PhnL
MTELVRVQNIAKAFTLHNQGGVHLPVLSDLSFVVSSGECLVLHGPSGAGKSSLLRMLYGNYKCTSGSIAFRHRDQWIDVVRADPREILDLRRHSLSYVSQFIYKICTTNGKKSFKLSHTSKIKYCTMTFRAGNG